MKQTNVNINPNHLRNIQDQYRLRVLQAKAGLHDKTFSVGIQQAFLADNPDLDVNKVANMYAGRSVSHDYLIRFENWCEDLKKDLNIKSKSAA